MRDRRLPSIAVSLALIVLTAGIFGQVAGHTFAPYDDDVYVYNNPNLAGGLSPAGVRWALTDVGYAGNWHPLTWLSHLADASLFGPRPGGHHLVNVVLHALNGVLLFALMVSLTGALWKSALVAALFVVHPLHVESVAWVSERKDLLAAFFSLLTLLTWRRWTLGPGVGRYLAAAGLFGLALMSKPMAVTIPLILLVLDWWPLGRLAGGPPPARGDVVAAPLGLPRLLMEKAPLMAMSAAASALTWVAQSRGGATAANIVYPFGERLGNALDASVVYLAETLWPAGLTFFYPHPGPSLPVWRPMVAALVLAGATAAALLLRKKRPWLLAGWLWYGVMLLPVLGLIQVGSQARADRYTYLSLTGVFVVGVWGVEALTARWKGRGPALAVVSAALVVALSAAAFVQTGWWRDGETLCRRAIAVTRGNWVALNNLGTILKERGDLEGAARYVSEAVAARPLDPKSHYNLGIILILLRRAPAAVEECRVTVRLSPAWPEAWYNLGVALFYAGRMDESSDAYREALRLNPGYVEALDNLGHNLLLQGRRGEAAQFFRRALSLRPGSAEIRESLFQAGGG
jgi:Flp pilus assembly protein TadD